MHLIRKRQIRWLPKGDVVGATPLHSYALLASLTNSTLSTAGASRSSGPICNRSTFSIRTGFSVSTAWYSGGWSNAGSDIWCAGLDESQRSGLLVVHDVVIPHEGRDE